MGKYIKRDGDYCMDHVSTRILNGYEAVRTVVSDRTGGYKDKKPVWRSLVQDERGMTLGSVIFYKLNYLTDVLPSAAFTGREMYTIRQHEEIVQEVLMALDGG